MLTVCSRPFPPLARIVTDNLFSQGTITSNEVAVSFEPTQQLDNVNGELTFGGTDSSKFEGSITFAYVHLFASLRSAHWC